MKDTVYLHSCLQLREEAESEVYVNVGRTMSFFFLRREEGEGRGDSIWCENSFIVHLDCEGGRRSRVELAGN